MSKIEQIINDMEDYIASCSKVAFSNNKIAVNKDDIEEYLSELRLRTPDEIKKYQRMLSNKDAILKDAKDQADSILAAAKKHTEELVSEHEIIQQAYQEADRVKNEAYDYSQLTVDNAAAKAEAIERNSIQYTDGILANLQMIIEHEIETNRAKYESLIASLEKELDVVIANRRELASILSGDAGSQDESVAEDDDNGYDGFDGEDN